MQKNNKQSAEEMTDMFYQISNDYEKALIRIGELQAENEILKGILIKNKIEIPEKYLDF